MSSLDMPSYSLEEKAKAFDLLWKNCGQGEGKLISYTHKTKQISESEVLVFRVPVYSFEICINKDVYKFKEVLHHLTQSLESKPPTPP